MRFHKLAGYLLIFLSYLGGWFWMEYDNARNNPVIFEKPVIIDIEKGDSFTNITEKLIAEHIAIKPMWFKLIAWQDDVASKIKFGEYELTPRMTLPDILTLLISGKTLHHTITFPEGWNFKAVRQELDANPYLEHTLKDRSNSEIIAELGITENHPEGLFFPDTYFFEKHTTDVVLLKRAYQKMQQILADEWRNRSENTPLTTPYQALVLASIIEKETAATHERMQISGVFSRRLELGMLLQTDPTVIYGMGENYQGDLKTSDLQTSTAYNTYMIKGLPPTPIAMAGQASLHAALHPDSSDNLYFVAKGDGTHIFSATLEAHNAAVDIYQRKKHESKP
jgi:UPF0755 protein